MKDVSMRKVNLYEQMKRSILAGIVAESEKEILPASTCAYFVKSGALSNTLRWAGVSFDEEKRKNFSETLVARRIEKIVDRLLLEYFKDIPRGDSISAIVDAFLRKEQFKIVQLIVWARKPRAANKWSLRPYLLEVSR